MIYRKPPCPEPDTDIPSRPEPPKKPKGSVALQLKKEDVAVTDPYMNVEGLLNFPRAEPVEDDHDVGLPEVANEDDNEEEMDPEAVKLLQEKMSAGTSRPNV